MEELVVITEAFDESIKYLYTGDELDLQKDKDGDYIDEDDSGGGTI